MATPQTVGGLGAMAPKPPTPDAAPANPAQAAQRISSLEQAPVEEDFMERALRNKRAQEEALNSQIEALKNSLDSRMKSPFDPALMAAASGFLRPTKTGGFGESAGYAAEAYAAETDKEMARRQAVDKAKLELAQKQAQMQSQNLMFEHQMQMAGYDPKEATTLTTGPAGAPAAGAPARAPREPRTITERDIAMAYAVSPEYGKQVMEQAKFQQDKFMSTPQGLVRKDTGKAFDTGYDTVIETSLPYIGVDKVTQKQLAKINQLDEQFPAGHPQRADQFARLYASIGVGGVSAPSGSSAPSAGTPAAGSSSGAPAGVPAGTPSAVPAGTPSGAAPSAGGTSFAGGFSSPSGGGMKPAAQRESERRMAEEQEKARIAIQQAAETETNKARITKGEDRASTLIDRGQAADTTKQIALDMSAWADSNPRVFQLMQTATLKDSILRSAEKMGAPLNIDPRIILQYKLTNNDIEAMQMFAQKSAQLTVELRKSSRSPGEGATDQSEGRLYSQVEALPTDTARVIGLKSELLALRTDYDKAAATLWVDWREQNPGKSFDKFRLSSDEFKALRKSYDSTLDAVRKANTDLLGSKAPAATSPANPPTSSPAPSGQPSRGNERVIGGNIWERQPDGSWKDSGRKAK